MIIASKLILIVNAQAVAVDQLYVAFLLRQLVQVAASKESFEQSASFAHVGQRSVTGFLAGAFVGLPVGSQAFG